MTTSDIIGGIQARVAGGAAYRILKTHEGKWEIQSEHKGITSNTIKDTLAEACVRLDDLLDYNTLYVTGVFYVGKWRYWIHRKCLGVYEFTGQKDAGTIMWNMTTKDLKTIGDLIEKEAEYAVDKEVEDIQSEPQHDATLHSTGENTQP